MPLETYVSARIPVDAPLLAQLDQPAQGQLRLGEADFVLVHRPPGGLELARKIVDGRRPDGAVDMQHHRSAVVLRLAGDEAGHGGAEHDLRFRRLQPAEIGHLADAFDSIQRVTVEVAEERGVRRGGFFQAEITSARGEPIGSEPHSNGPPLAGDMRLGPMNTARAVNRPQKPRAKRIDVPSGT